MHKCLIPTTTIHRTRSATRLPRHPRYAQIHIITFLKSPIIYIEWAVVASLRLAHRGHIRLQWLWPPIPFANPQFGYSQFANPQFLTNAGCLQQSQFGGNHCMCNHLAQPACNAPLNIAQAAAIAVRNNCKLLPFKCTFYRPFFFSSRQCPESHCMLSPVVSRIDIICNCYSMAFARARRHSVILDQYLLHFILSQDAFGNPVLPTPVCVSFVRFHVGWNAVTILCASVLYSIECFPICYKKVTPNDTTRDVKRPSLSCLLLLRYN